MMPPLVVVDTYGEISIFDTPEAVSRQLEAQDVLNDEFRLFDSAGVEYPLLAESDQSPVIVGSPAAGEAEFEHVLAIARAYLARLPPRARRRAPAIDPTTPEELSRALRPFAT